MDFIKRIFSFASKKDTDEVKKLLQVKIGDLRKPALRL